MTTWMVTVRHSWFGAAPVQTVTITSNGATAVVQLTERTAPLSEAAQPNGTAPTVNVTVPANPLIGVTVIVDVPATVANVVIAGAESEKS